MQILSSIPNIKHADSNNFFLIAGPCVVENKEICFSVAEEIIKITDKLNIPYIFKASFKQKRHKYSGFNRYSFS